MKRLRKVLVIDGGGLKGIIPAVFLNKFEQSQGLRCYQMFDLICGTSTGAVIGGTLAAGVPAETVERLYREQVPGYFRKRFPFPNNWIRERYDRKPFMDELRRQVNDCELKDTKTGFLTTAFNLCSHRTHFIRNTDPSENMYPLADVMSWSALSAAYFFGKISVPDFRWEHTTPEGHVVSMNGAVFQDGGQGTQNSPILVGLMEAIARWGRDDVDIQLYSVGCGTPDDLLSYDKAAKVSLISQVIKYTGQARGESEKMQRMGAEYLDRCWSNFEFVRFNISLPKKMDKLDGIKYVNEYIKYGHKMSQRIIKWPVEMD